MKRPTFLQGVALALGFALAGAAVFSALSLVYAPGVILKALITGCAALYVGYLLARSDERTGRVRPALTGVRTIVGISTYGSPRPSVVALNDNGRRTLTRALRMNCGLHTRTRWLGLYALDGTTATQRAEFAATVEREMLELR
jgi:hypothetical protein